MSSKCIVVTGVSRGLGAALTAEFVQRGHTVAGCARSREAVGALALRYPGPHLFDAVDVADYDTVRQWACRVVDHIGVPDLVINNAAVITENAPLWQTEPDAFSQIVDVNIKGVFHILRTLLPLMIERGSGVVVNLSSGWGRSTSPEVAPYCATKWAVEGMTRALADELPYGLAAIPLNPGIIHTEMLESCFGPSARSYPSPQEWARRAAPFLLELGPDDNGDPLTAPS